jgi:hypothetical protein
MLHTCVTACMYGQIFHCFYARFNSVTYSLPTYNLYVNKNTALCPVTDEQVPLDNFSLPRNLLFQSYKADFQSSHEAPRCECLHLIKINCFALWLDESAHACTRSELRGASCEDWKTASFLSRVTARREYRRKFNKPWQRGWEKFGLAMWNKITRENK